MGEEVGLGGGRISTILFKGLFRLVALSLSIVDAQYTVRAAFFNIGSLEKGKETAL